MKILVVQRDLGLAKDWKSTWKKKGDSVDLAANYEEALSFFYQGHYQVILLDVWMKGGDAFAFLEKVRERDLKVGVIFLSEDGSYRLKRQAFEGGGDDFLTKDVGEEELYWHMAALGRRVYLQREYEKQQLEWRDVRLDLFQRKAYKNGEILKLKAREFRLLKVLLQNKGLVLHRDTLRREVCGNDATVNSNVVDSYVKSLRKSLGDEDKTWIRTLRGYGYGIKD